MSEPQPSNGAETNGAKPAPAGLESLAAVGSRLAQLRETRGWTVDDVSARLKVAPQKLRALEAGDISHLPGVTFALGVVRSYAKMLGVDPEPFAQALRRERGVPAIADGGIRTSGDLVNFAENRKLAQEWTFRFLGAAVREHLMGEEAHRLLPED